MPDWATWKGYPQTSSLSRAHKPEWIQNEQAVSIQATCLLFKNRGLTIADKGRKKWLIVHASHLDHLLSPYQAWEGSVLCPHLLVWAMNFLSSRNGLQTWEWSYSQPGTEILIPKEGWQVIHHASQQLMSTYESKSNVRHEQLLLALMNCSVQSIHSNTSLYKQISAYECRICWQGTRLWDLRPSSFSR